MSLARSEFFMKNLIFRSFHDGYEDIIFPGAIHFLKNIEKEQISFTASNEKIQIKNDIISISDVGWTFIWMFETTNITKESINFMFLLGVLKSTLPDVFKQALVQVRHSPTQFL